MRRNEYISTENTRYQPKVYDQAESKVGYSIKRKLSQIDFYKDRDSQIKAIEKSFEAAKLPVCLFFCFFLVIYTFIFFKIDKHFSKQGVFPLQVLPICPDFNVCVFLLNYYLVKCCCFFCLKLWKYSFSQVIFDTDPASKGKSVNQVEEMSQAMIRGMIDENGDQFVAYFLPTEDTLAKRKRFEQENVEPNSDEE